MHLPETVLMVKQAQQAVSARRHVEPVCEPGARHVRAHGRTAWLGFACDRHAESLVAARFVTPPRPRRVGPPPLQAPHRAGGAALGRRARGAARPRSRSRTAHRASKSVGPIAPPAITP